MEQVKTAQPKIFHYETQTNRLVIEVAKGENVEFIGGSFTTDNEDVAKKIEDTNYFKLGNIWRSNAIAVEKKRQSNKRTRSGARAAN